MQLSATNKQPSGLPPVIAIDGPAASGKGTVAKTVAAACGFHYLDSGRLYRAAALATRQNPSTPTDAVLATLIADKNQLDALLQSPDLTSSDTAQAASVLAAQPLVREALKNLQKTARQPPGLVADGRDMGSVIFPDAVVKVYLTASLAVRAARRHQQLLEKSQTPAIIDDIREELRQRDSRDTIRTQSPLEKPLNAVYIDSSRLNVSDVVQIILRRFHVVAIYPHPAQQGGE